MTLKFRLRTWVAAFAFGALAIPAIAQDAKLNTIVVTGSKIDTEGLAAMPNVYIRVPADFVQFGVNCQSSTRDVTERKDELRGQFDKIKAWAAAGEGYELNGGVAGEETIPLDTLNFDEIARGQYGNSLTFSLVLSADVQKEETFDGVKLRVKQDIDSIEAVGRSECFLDDDQYLGVRNIDEHRKTLLRNLAVEVQNMKTIFGKSAVMVSGLESRVISQPSGSLILDVFIPYSLKIEIED